MTTSRRESYRGKIFMAGAIKDAMVDAIRSIDRDPDDFHAVHSRKLEDGTEHSDTIELQALWPICTLAADEFIVAFPRGPLYPKLSISGGRESIHVGAESSAPDEVPRLIQSLEASLSLDKKRRGSSSGPSIAKPAPQLGPPPAQITISWLIEYVPFKAWVAAVAVLAAVFLAGIYVGQTTFAREILEGLGWWTGRPQDGVADDRTTIGPGATWEDFETQEHSAQPTRNPD